MPVSQPSICRGVFRSCSPLKPDEFHSAAGLQTSRKASLSAQRFGRFFVSLSRLLQQPHSRGLFPQRCQPSRYAHRSKFKIAMRPTGEASKPDSGDFDCRSFGSSSCAKLYLPCPAASQSFCAPGFPGDATSRVDSVWVI